MMEQRSLLIELRALGVKRAVLVEGSRIGEVEFFDTIPAPAPEWVAAEDEPEPKLPTQCIAMGCASANGWQFDSRYCAEHGRAAAGVRR